MSRCLQCHKSACSPSHDVQTIQYCDLLCKRCANCTSTSNTQEIWNIGTPQQASAVANWPVRQKSCCRQSSTICAINYNTVVERRSSEVLSTQLTDDSPVFHALSVSISDYNTLWRSICCGEIFLVHSLEQTSRGSTLAFESTRISL